MATLLHKVLWDISFFWLTAPLSLTFMDKVVFKFQVAEQRKVWRRRGKGWASYVIKKFPGYRHRTLLHISHWWTLIAWPLLLQGRLGNVVFIWGSPKFIVIAKGEYWYWGTITGSVTHKLVHSLCSISHYFILGFADTHPSFFSFLSGCNFSNFSADSFSARLPWVLVFPAFGPHALFSSHSMDFIAWPYQIHGFYYSGFTYLHLSSRSFFFLNPRLIYPISWRALHSNILWVTNSVHLKLNFVFPLKHSILSSLSIHMFTETEFLRYTWSYPLHLSHVQCPYFFFFLSSPSSLLLL